MNDLQIMNQPKQKKEIAKALEANKVEKQAKADKALKKEGVSAKNVILDSIAKRKRSRNAKNQTASHTKHKLKLKKP